MKEVWGGVILENKPKHYHCMNNACGYYIESLKKGKPKHKQRWKMLTAYLTPESFVHRTFCPHCKWELKIGLNEEKKVDEPKLSALELLKVIPNSTVLENAKS